MSLSNVTPVHFKAGPIVSTHTSSEILNEEEFTSASGRPGCVATVDHTQTVEDAQSMYNAEMTLSTEQSRRLLTFLTRTAVFSRSVKTDPSLLLLPELPPHLDPFLRRLFKKPSSKPTTKLISWIEVHLESPDLLKADGWTPKPFKCVLHRDLILRTPVTRLSEDDANRSIEGDLARDGYVFSRTRISSPVLFMGRSVGRYVRFTLSSQCDLVSYREDPMARYLFEHGSTVSRSDLRLLLDLSLFPLRLLNAMVQGNSRPYKSTEDEVYPEHCFHEDRTQPELALFGDDSNLVLDKNLYSPILDKMRLAQWSATFKLNATNEAAKWIQDSSEKTLTKKELHYAIYRFLASVVASPTAVFNAEVLHAPTDTPHAMVSKFTNVSVTTDTLATKGSNVSGLYRSSDADFMPSDEDTVKTKIGSAKRDDDRALEALEANLNGGRIGSTTIRSFRRYRNCTITRYSLTFHMHDPDRIWQTIQAHRQAFENSRQKHSAMSGVSAPSADQLYKDLFKSIEVRVTAYSDPISCLGIKNLSQLRSHILSVYAGSVNAFGERIIQEAFDSTNILYWNNYSQWLPTVKGSAEDAAEQVTRFVQAKKPKALSVLRHEIEDSEWSSMSKMWERIQNNPERVTEFLRTILMEKMVDTGIKTKSSDRLTQKIKRIPELSVLFFLHWNLYSSENFGSLLRDWDLLSDDDRQLLAQERGYSKPAQQRRRILLKMIDDVLEFTKANFNVDMLRSKQLHEEVAYRLNQLFTNSRKNRANPTRRAPDILNSRKAALDSLSNLLTGTEATSAAFTDTLFRDLRTRRAFDSVRMKKPKS